MIWTLVMVSKPWEAMKPVIGAKEVAQVGQAVFEIVPWRTFYFRLQSLEGKQEGV
jgi:hypothetical protein